MNFFKPVSRMRTTVVSNDVLAGKEAKSGRARQAICITSVGTSYVGEKDEVEASTGMKLKDGERIFLPVETSRCDQFYIKGKCELTEFF